MRSWKALVFLLLGVVLAGATACNPFGGGEETITRQLVEVTRGNLTVTINGDGTIGSYRNMKLSFGTGGKINRLYFKEGAKVSEGAILAKIDTSALELAHTQAQVAATQAQLSLTQAQLASQTAEYELERTLDKKDFLDLALLREQIGLSTAKYALDKAKDVYRWPEVETVQADVDKARSYLEYALQKLSEATTATAIETWTLAVVRTQASLDIAEAKLKALIAGYDKEEVAIKKMQVDAAQMAVTQAQKNVNDLTKEITIKQQQAAATQEAVAQAKQSLEFARQSLAQAQKNLDEAVITAPFDGIIASITVEEGDTVFSTTNIIHLVDPTSLELTIELDEIDIPQAKPNQEAIVRLDALPDVKFNGKVTTIYPLPNTVGGVVLYKVKIKLDVPPDSAVKVGMSASADIIIDKRENVLLVPSRAIEERQGKPYVKTIVGNQVIDREVATGISDGTETEIVSGLNEGEKVVIETRVKPKSTGGGLFGT